MKINLASWVEEEENPGRRRFRQAVHLVIRAVANSPLSQQMVMKGGILLAVRYNSLRFTTDVDFSTQKKFQEVHLPTLISTFTEALSAVSSDNDYGLAIGLQTHVIQPKNNPSPTFPTCRLTVAYANRADHSEMARFAKKNAPKVIQIDYSFNEWAPDVEINDIDGGLLSVYAYHDLIAEKIRAVLQQPIRNRYRFQDIYDLWLLLSLTKVSDSDRLLILDKLSAATKDRQVLIGRMAMRNPLIIEHSKREYSNVIALIAATPPSFEDAYTAVQDFFESLPWPDALLSAPAAAPLPSTGVDGP